MIQELIDNDILDLDTISSLNGFLSTLINRVVKTPSFKKYDVDPKITELTELKND